MSNLEKRAAIFARKAHGDQVRKYTGEPYVVHTQEVAAIVASVGGTPEMIAAAHLHDVLEDTPTTAAEIEAAFGPTIARLVEALSDQVSLSLGNRTVRKRAESDRLAACSAEVQTIKLADIISNTLSITKHDPGFAKVYVPECRYLAERMVDGDAALRARALRLLT